MTITIYSELVQRAVEQFGDKPAMWIRHNDSFESTSYNQFHQSMNQLASALKLRGFTEEDNAIIIGANRPEWIIAFHTAFFAGKCAIPADPNLPVDEIEEILHRTNAAAVFCDAEYIPLFEQLKEKSPFLETIVLLNGELSEESEALTFAQILSEGTDDLSVFDRSFSPNDPMSILFTSGTTGRSKGVVLMQKNYCNTAEYAFEMMDLSTDDRFLAVLPLYHVFGFAATVAGPLMRGCDIVLIPEIRGPLITGAMRELGVTVLPAVPQMLTLMLENIRKGVAEKGAVVKTVFSALIKLSPLAKLLGGRALQRKLFHSVHEKFGNRFCKIISGGASLDPTSFATYQAMGFDIVEGYGLTETMGPITLCPVTDQIQGAVGKVIGTNELKIDSPDREGWGEVLFRGDSVFGGYLDDTASTRAVFTNDEWFKTGDRGKIDRRGFLSLSGRIKEIIVLDSGKNVYPDELKHYYESSPFIEEIGIFGIKEKGRTVVAALVVPPKLTHSTTKTEIYSDLREEMIRLAHGRPDYKRVGTYLISDQPLPRTSTKKIKSHTLPDLYAQIKAGTPTGEVTPVTAIERQVMREPLYREVAQALIELAPTEITPNELTPQCELLRDVGIDSLRMLELASLIDSRLDRAIEPEKLAQVITVEDLVRETREAESATTSKPLRELLHEGVSEITEEPRRNGLFASFVLWNAKLIAGVLWGLRARGRENIPLDKAVIFASNHLSYLDGPLLYASLSASLRARTYLLLKAELTRSSISNRLVRLINMISVERNGDIIPSLLHSYAALSKGHNILIFPEGMQSPNGETQEFRAGVGVLLKESDTTVVPVHIVNTDRKWPRGKSIKLLSGWRYRPEFIFGTPFTLADIGMNSNSSDREIAAAIRERVVQTK
jgi:long-chain acyl-CoA synthetase